MNYRCLRCNHVHDVGDVEIVQRYADCTTWKCPNCKSVIDDRPKGWGGSAERVRAGEVTYDMYGAPQVVVRTNDGRTAVRKPGQTAAEALGIDTTGQPGGSRQGYTPGWAGAPGSVPKTGTKRTDRELDYDANWHPEAY